jgi:hypothetical protein
VHSQHAFELMGSNHSESLSHLQARSSRHKGVEDPDGDDLSFVPDGYNFGLQHLSDSNNEVASSIGELLEDHLVQLVRHGLAQSICWIRFSVQ